MHDVFYIPYNLIKNQITDQVSTSLIVKRQIKATTQPTQITYSEEEEDVEEEEEEVVSLSNPSHPLVQRSAQKQDHAQAHATPSLKPKSNEAQIPDTEEEVEKALQVKRENACSMPQFKPVGRAVCRT